MKEVFLTQEIFSQLSDSERALIATLLTYRCRMETYNRVRSYLLYMPVFQLFSKCDWIRRIYYVVGDNGVKDFRYCAGQSYPDEIRTIREIILGKK